MKKKTPIPFYVIIDDLDKQKFIKYDVMNYLIYCYVETKKDKRPKTFYEFKGFVSEKSTYMFWSRLMFRSRYMSEICLIGCGDSRTEATKIDVRWQIENNLDLVTKLLMLNVGINAF